MVRSDKKIDAMSLSSRHSTRCNFSSWNSRCPLSGRRISDHADDDRREENEWQNGERNIQAHLQLHRFLLLLFDAGVSATTYVRTTSSTIRTSSDRARENYCAAREYTPWSLRHLALFPL